MLSSLIDYSQVVYTLLTSHPTIQHHTIRIYPRCSLVGVVEGTVEFEQEVTLRIYERVDFARQQILVYFHEVWQGQQQLYWDDPTPHPHIPALNRISCALKYPFVLTPQCTYYCLARRIYRFYE
jgi:hypothetical protein